MCRPYTIISKRLHRLTFISNIASNTSTAYVNRFRNIYLQNIYESLDTADEEAVEVKAKTQVDSEKAESRNGKMVELDIEEKNGDVRRRPSYSGADTSAARKQLKKLGEHFRRLVQKAKGRRQINNCLTCE